MPLILVDIKQRVGPILSTIKYRCLNFWTSFQMIYLLCKMMYVYESANTLAKTIVQDLVNLWAVELN